ncbi:MAG: dihydroorotase [Lachnospiraceae bacterium]|nr:dihydroorotase [Lachnospiraceae bacterium]
MSILIKNGQVIDPDTKRNEVCDVLIENGLIARVEKSIEEAADQVIDAAGCYVMPGLIDMHVHFRDPGLTYKEDIQSGSKAAAKGGVTTVVAMPNTKPVIDSPDRVDYVANKAKQFSPIHVLQAGAITKGQKGEELADIEGMADAGIPAISEDGKSVMNALLYKEAMEIAAERKIPVLAHCEDINLVNGGCMNEDEHSRAWRLPGITNSVENTIVARDIVLAQETGAHLHLCHCSTKECVDMIKDARKAGVSISAEVCPHHFTLSSDDIVKGDTNYKMNPPLRAKEDVEALRQGLKEDVFDVISTDHAPHSHEEKQNSFRKAPFGIVGLETSVALTITELVDTGILTPMQMAEKMSYNPAKILHLEDKGSLAVGKCADVVVIDPKAEYVIDPKTFVSKGKNTPFGGKKVKGKVVTTICDGKIVYQE